MISNLICNSTENAENGFDLLYCRQNYIRRLSLIAIQISVKIEHFPESGENENQTALLYLR